MIIAFAFGCLVAAWGPIFFYLQIYLLLIRSSSRTNAFSLLTAQIFGPYGYSSTESGILVMSFYVILWCEAEPSHQAAVVILVIIRLSFGRDS